jgi:hypothetical protein
VCPEALFEIVFLISSKYWEKLWRSLGIPQILQFSVPVTGVFSGENALARDIRPHEIKALLSKPVTDAFYLCQNEKHSSSNENKGIVNTGQSYILCDLTSKVCLYAIKELGCVL